MMKEFTAEVRQRAGEGYSVRQLIKSHIPDIGTEVKVKDSEVTAAVQEKDCWWPGVRGGPPPLWGACPGVIIYF